jgi:hypothetical protein
MVRLVACVKLIFIGRLFYKKANVNISLGKPHLANRNGRVLAFRNNVYQGILILESKTNGELRVNLEKNVRI